MTRDRSARPTRHGARLFSGLVVLCALSASAVATDAVAAPPDPRPPGGAPSINVTALPLFGAEAAVGDAWLEIVARIENTGATAQKGSVELVSTSMYGAGDPEPIARAPYNVPAGRTAIVKIPMRGEGSGSPILNVVAFSESGTRLSAVTVTVNASSAPLLVDVDQPSRLAVPMRGWSIPAMWNPGGRGSGYASSALTMGAPSYDRTTGDPILPDRAAGYSAVTVVLIHADRLVSLEEGELDALVSWVIAGGTLAVVPSRPDDLHAPLLKSLVGGDVRATAAPGAFAKLPVFEKPANAPTIGSPPGGDDEEDTPPTTSPTQYGVTPPSTPKLRTLRVGPSAAIRDKLTGYTGGNLRASDFGASAPYGAGEVHLLGFDPTASPMLDDPWIHSRVVAMVSRGWDRRATNAFALGVDGGINGRIDHVRRALDPNENFRIGLAVSTLLLVLYSIVAGPLTFARAAKKGKPLGPLLWVPIWSAIAFFAIVIVGLAGKGWHGRARHMSLVEVNGGFGRGTIRRFRGFFASEARSLAVPETDRGSALEVASADGRTSSGLLKIDRSGMTLAGITALPWQTVVVSEDGFLDLHGGITVWPAPDGGITIVNRSGAALKDVLARAPSGALTYITTIADGESVNGSSGRALATASTGAPLRSRTAGLLSTHPLGARDLQSMLPTKEGERVGNAWDPLEEAALDTVDWWPDGTAIVMGEMVGLPKPAKDSGLSVESDRVMFRVVGTGGVP